MDKMELPKKGVFRIQSRLEILGVNIHQLTVNNVGKL